MYEPILSKRVRATPKSAKKSFMSPNSFDETKYSKPSRVYSTPRFQCHGFFYQISQHIQECVLTNFKEICRGRPIGQKMKPLKFQPREPPSLCGSERAFSQPEGSSISLKVRYALALLGFLLAWEALAVGSRGDLSSWEHRFRGWANSLSVWKVFLCD